MTLSLSLSSIAVRSQATQDSSVTTSFVHLLLSSHGAENQGTASRKVAEVVRVIYGLPTGWLGTEVATFSIQDTPSRLRRSRFCFGRGCGSFTHSSSSTTDGAAIFELGSIWLST
jgi:hypothetical protein